MDATEEERAHAVRRLKAKHGFRQHLTTYIVVNLFLIVIWAMTDFGGYFWPVWPIAGWGIAILLHGWDTYRGPAITEADIQKEIERNRARGA